MTPKKKEEFLRHLAKSGVVTHAARCVGISRGHAYLIRDNDDDFKRAWDDAVEQSIDIMILEAKRRAERGTLKPVFYQGVQCGEIREYSDSLMMFLVKGKRPEYATERRQLTGADDKPLFPDGTERARHGLAMLEDIPEDEV